MKCFARLSTVLLISILVLCSFGANAQVSNEIVRSANYTPVEMKASAELQSILLGAVSEVVNSYPNGGFKMEDIAATLIDLRDRGVAVLVISEELDELMEICDRLAVIAEGRLSEAKSIHATSAEEIGMLMAGSHATRGEPSADAARA